MREEEKLVRDLFARDDENKKKEEAEKKKKT
jgi:hypothetical protein